LNYEHSCLTNSKKNLDVQILGPMLKVYPHYEIATINKRCQLIGGHGNWSL